MSTTKQKANTGTYNNPYKFNGKELDAETGNYYYGARYYNPSLSMWLSVDPLAEKYPGVSPYVYTLQNPVRYVDPNGMEPDGWVRDLSDGSLYLVNDMGGDDMDFVYNAFVNECGAIELESIDALVVEHYDSFDGDFPTEIEPGLRIHHYPQSGAIIDEGLGPLEYFINPEKVIEKGVVAFGKGVALGLARKGVLNQNIDDIRNGKNVTVKTFKEADEILFGAFPNAKKVSGAGNKSKEKMILQQKEFKGTHKDGKYHKDFKKNEDGVIYGHENLPDGHPHKTVPHINVKTPEGMKSTIYIEK
ncbi:MAG: RHS repeat-associated core domain-containing protein [Chitinophagales bacterium]|nr:RHS repeat-associated core domain-containing protein [Bacteroidota bacterium]